MCSWVISLRCAATQPTIGHVPYESPSPITVPDHRPGPNLPNPLSPCNQPPCNRRKSRQAKLDANRAAGFEAARVHASTHFRVHALSRGSDTGSWVGYGHQAGSQRVSVMPGSSRRVSWPQVASHTVTAARARAVGTRARLFAGRVKIRLTLSSSVVHPPWHCGFVWGQVRMGQVRMIRRAAFDPPSRQSRGRRFGGSKSADQGFVFPRRRRCNTR